MVTFSKAYKYLTNKYYRFEINSSFGIYNRMNDEEYIKNMYYCKMGKELDLDNPKTYTEKLQWLKLYDRNPLYTQLVDKLLVRNYVSAVIGEEYLIPLLGSWNTPKDIDFDLLPDKFVLKCNHNSGLGMCICNNKDSLDIKRARANLSKGLKQDYYLSGREWPYKNVPRKIICEQYMEDLKSGDLKDYKIFVFNGKAKLMFVASDRQNPTTETKFDFYDLGFNHLDIINGHPNSSNADAAIKPLNFEKMLELAEALGKDIPHVRVDFYDINGKIYFGEMTFFHWSGFVPFEPESWDEVLGSWINLPENY